MAMYEVALDDPFGERAGGGDRNEDEQLQEGASQRSMRSNKSKRQKKKKVNDDADDIEWV